MIEYKLYAMPITQKNIDAVASSRFGRITRNYALIYAESEPDCEQKVEVDGENGNLLTSLDKQWLFDCTVALIAEQAKDREADICAELSGKLNELERALKEEQEKLTAKVGDDG